MTKAIEKIIQKLKPIASEHTAVSMARVVAALVYKNRIMTIGYNSTKTHPFATKYAKNEHAIFIHAETDAIRKAKHFMTEQDIAKCTLVVVRVRTTNEEFPISKQEVFGMAKPCPGCQRCIEDFGIKRVVYTQYCDLPDEMIYTTWTKK